jgi:4-hydroxybenzoate polyprenyltransferase
MRWDRPIGFLLLLWPTLWALWLASEGKPDPKIFFIFVAGVILMRSAGCVLNDIADRHFDAHVERTRERPLATGSVSLIEALLLASLLCLLAFLLVLQCNALTIALAFIGAGLAAVYPLMKRFTHLPQLGLGVAFSWGVPMAFAAETGSLSLISWFLFLTAVVWPVIYDTMYAMVDRNDDIKIGIKSTAVLLNTMDRLVIGLLQLLFLVMFVIVGLMFGLNLIFYLSLVAASFLFVYQQWLIKARDPKRCLQAFINNNIVGFVIFVGISLSYVE